MTVAAHEIANTLQGSQGAVVYTFRYEKRTSDYRFLADITDAVLDCAIQCENNRPTTMSADFTFDPNIASIDPINDFIAVFAELSVLKDDGAIEVEEFPLGLYHLNVPDKNYEPGLETWSVRATDLSIFLIESELSVPYTVPGGTNYITAIEELLDTLDIDVLYDFPETDYVTPNDLTWGGISKNKLDVANELLQGINFYPLWQRLDGVFTSREQIAPHEETVNIIQRGNELIVPPLKERIEPGTHPNDVRIIIDDPLRVPEFALKVNVDDESELSFLNSKQITSEQIVSIAVVNQSVAEELADYYLQRSAALAHQATLQTFPDFRRSPHEFYRVELDGITEPDDTWMVIGWSLGLKTGSIMNHKIGRALPIDISYEYNATILRDDATHFWRLNEIQGELTITATDVEEEFTMPATSFYTGTTLAIEPSSIDRHRIRESQLLPSGQTRYFAQLRIYQTGNVDLEFASTELEALGARNDLSDAFEETGEIDITIDGDTLTISIANADSSEPYQWTPTNDAEVIAFYNAHGSKANQSRSPTITLRIPAASHSHQGEFEDTGLAEDKLPLAVTIGAGASPATTLLGDGDSESASLQLATNTNVESEIVPTPADNLWDNGGTVEFLIEPTTDGDIIDKGEWELYVDSSDRLNLEVDFSTTDGHWRETTGSVSPGEKHHVSVKYNSDSASNNPMFVIDGIEKSGTDITRVTTPVGMRTDDSSSRFTIGAQSSSARDSFTGNLQEVAVYENERSTHVLAGHYYRARL